MEIIVGKTAGFCFGVKNAVTRATEKLESNKEVYCLGELVHNRQVTEELEKKGMHFIDNIDDAKDLMIIRTHGVEESIYDRAKIKKIELVDLTCPKVLHIHNIVNEYAKKDYYIILIGKKEHPEVIGTKSYCGDSYSIIEDENNIQGTIEHFKKSGKKQVLIIAQTTFSMEKFRKFVESILNEVGKNNVVVKNTICNATRERQEETKEIAQKVDAMIILGGKNSSNSNKLYELAKEHCKKVYFVETANDLNIDDFKEFNSIGIMAGASTPQESINKTVEKLKEMC